MAEDQVSIGLIDPGGQHVGFAGEPQIMKNQTDAATIGNPGLFTGGLKSAVESVRQVPVLIWEV